MSSSKKPKEPKRLFSKKNRARRAPIDLHPHQYDLEPVEIKECADVDDFDEGVRLPRADLAGVAPLAPPHADPDDVNEYGMFKMSVVLKLLVEPFLELDRDMDEVELNKLFQFAAMAWNMAILGDVDVRAEMRKAFGGVWRWPWRKRAASDVVAEMVEAMIRRKHELFETDRRVITKVKVTTLPDGGHYILVSTALTPRR